MRRNECSACGSADLETFLNLGSSPIADAYTDTPDVSPPRFPLEVAVCAKCKLVQLLEVLDGPTLFGTGYSFYSSDSPPLSLYHAAYARDVLDRYGHLAGRGVVEVGCNDGDLLRHFAHLPHLGIDPSTGPTEAARERGCNVATMQFGQAAAQDIEPAGVVIANHVLAHVEDVSDTLAGIAHVLTAAGVAIVEVQYLPDLLVNNAFDLVYHEHRNFFSLTSLEHAALRQGLNVVDAELTDRQGGSVRVTLTKGPRPSHEADRLRASETWLNSLCAYEGMQGRAERIRGRLRTMLQAETATGRTVAAYGAPAKATTLLNFCGAMGITKVIDPAPGKVGRHIPGVGLPIVSPDHTMTDPNATLALLAWNYAGPIMRQYAHFPGRWLVPFPAPVML